MPEQPDHIPAGWYPDPAGGQRYWDGSKWLALPEPDASQTGSPRKRPPKKVLIAISAAILLAVGGGTIWKISHDANVRAEQDAAAAAIQLAADEEATRLEAERAAKESEDAGERARRTLAVENIESNVKTMAEEHVTKGIMDGPIISVSCSPVGGGSTDDLTETTTVFDCFAANEDNGDGTMSGYKYHATMNWSSGEFTYGLGKP